MLEVELDIFSGRENPTWILSDREEKELLDILTSDPTQISPEYTSEEQFGLGYRGLIVREIKPDEGIWNRTNRVLESPFPKVFRVGSKPAKQTAVEWLLNKLNITDGLREEALRGVILVPSPREVVDTVEENEISRAIRWETCHSNYFDNNLPLFNDHYDVKHSNCYAFAANHPGAGRYAKPGLQGGRPARNTSCSEVIGGLYADGWTHHGCWPSASAVLIIACVIKPGPPEVSDFHFYRCIKNSGDWFVWGHKQGATFATKDDASGRPIHNPETCNRGDYTDFCGYFYANGPRVTVKCNTRCYP